MKEKFENGKEDEKKVKGDVKKKTEWLEQKIKNEEINLDLKKKEVKLNPQSQSSLRENALQLKNRGQDGVRPPTSASRELQKKNIDNRTEIIDKKGGISRKEQILMKLGQNGTDIDQFGAKVKGGQGKVSDMDLRVMTEPSISHSFPGTRNTATPQRSEKKGDNW